MQKEIDLEPIKEQLEKVKAEIKSPLPTPPVGFTVVWYPRAVQEEDNQVAGIVTKVEGPGKVTLTVFRPQGMPDATRRGCLHVTHPVHEKRANSVSVNAGSWDYIPGENIPKSHYERHLEALYVKQESLEKQIENASEIAKKQSSGSQPSGQKTTAKATE